MTKHICGVSLITLENKIGVNYLFVVYARILLGIVEKNVTQRLLYVSFTKEAYFRKGANNVLLDCQAQLVILEELIPRTLRNRKERLRTAPYRLMPLILQLLLAIADCWSVYSPELILSDQ